MVGITLGQVRLQMLKSALNCAREGTEERMDRFLSLAREYSSEMNLPWSEGLEKRIRDAYAPSPIVHRGSPGYEALSTIKLNGNPFYAAYIENIVGPEVTNALTRGGFAEFRDEGPLGSRIVLTEKGREALYNAV